MSWIKTTSIIFSITAFLFLSVDYSLTALNLYPDPKEKEPTNVTFEGKKLRVSHEIFHHGFSPNYQGMQAWSNYSYEVCTDQHSFKTSCAVFSNDTEKYFDIAFIGDSFTEALGMEYEDSFVGMFAADNTKLRVANLGASSYSPSIYYSKLKYLIDEGYKFERVFIFIDISDIQDEAKYILKNGRVGDYKENKLEHKDNDGSYDFVKNDFHQGLSKHLKLSAILYSLIKYGEVRKPSYTVPTGIYRGEWTYNNESPAYGLIGVSGAKEKALRIMGKVYELLNGNDIKMSIAVYPWPNQIFNDKLIDSQQSGMWKEFCKNKCEYFFDVFIDYSELVNSSSPLSVYNKHYILGDVHFNKAGNTLVYERIKRTIGEDFKDIK